jgi:phosphate starvation-inducible PhoH-like protein
MVARRKFKEIPEEDIQELHDFLEQDNKQEVVTVSTISINIKCKTENQKKLINSIKQKEITICSGLPGTGKTFLSCAQALKLIKGFAKYKRIVLIKSVTTLKNEEIGFLKGTMEEKMEPYIDSFMDNFRKLIGKSRTLKLRSLGIIEVLPIAFARGRSIDNSIIIIDEAQNVSLDNLRTLMTRIGDNSKMIILGDVKQKDIRNKKDSSLEVVLDKFKGVEGFGCVELRDPKDVVRNPIIKTIEEIFEKMEN